MDINDISAMEYTEQDFDKAIELLKPFTSKDPDHAGLQFFSSMLFLWGSLCCSFYFFESLPFVLPVTIFISFLFMCRSFVLVHDAGHHSLFRLPLFNRLVGNVVGFGIMVPYSMWQFTHNSHHSHVGNLDKRFLNPDIWTMTVREYLGASTPKRFLYRIMRSRFGRLLITPTLNFGIAGRLIHPKYTVNVIVSVLIHNVVYGFLFWLLISRFGFVCFFFSYLLPLVAFFGMAAFTVYGQHQFESTYWKHEQEWSWKMASMLGSSNLQAPRWYRWLVGNNIHHSAHHINPSIPNFKLHDAQHQLDVYFQQEKIPVSRVWKRLGLSLWDEDQQKLISFNELSKM